MNPRPVRPVSGGVRVVSCVFLGLLGLVAGPGCWAEPDARAEPEPATDPQLAFAVTDDAGFTEMGEPGPFDWLARFDEPGQSFERYVASEPVRAEGERTVLAFLPIGPFTKTEREVFDRTVEFARLWFGLETRTLPAVPLPKTGWQRRVGGRTQYRTPYFLDHLLPDHLPKDAVCLFGVTMGDLYPDDDWNFVFGQASLRRRVAVWSFVRFFPSFHGAEPSPATLLLALRRACKLVVHEAGHAFGLEHCIEYECNMAGSNNLEESDRYPLRLCPPCLRKLQWNRGFDVLARYEKLSEFYRAYRLAAELGWTRRRLARIRRR